MTINFPAARLSQTYYSCNAQKIKEEGEFTILILSVKHKNETHPNSTKARKPQTEKALLESVVCPLLHEAGLWVKVPSYFPLMDYGSSEQISIYGYFGKVLHVHRPSTKEIVINRV